MCGIVAVTILFITHVPAETYPSRSIQVIVPATPGGPADTAIRVIEPDLSAVLGTPLILVNRPGASGIVGMSGVAAAAPNGYTIGAGVNSIFTVVRISASTVPFTADDFLIIGNYASDVSILAVRPDAPWRSFEEFIDHARSNPRQIELCVRGSWHRILPEHAIDHHRVQIGHHGGAFCRRGTTYHGRDRRPR
jgi:tripartite-type tricarboxylate transporter receptor subunit TctC